MNNKLRLLDIFMALFIITGLSFMLGMIDGKALAADDIDSVDKVIDKFQEAYSSKNIQEVQDLFHYKAIVGIDFYSNTEQKIMTVNEWASATKEVFKDHHQISDKLTNRQIDVHRGSLATVVCDYDYKDIASHQVGVDIFTLMKIKGKWKIVSLIFSGDAAKKK
jgi:hypothetical protein